MSGMRRSGVLVAWVACTILSSGVAMAATEVPKDPKDFLVDKAKLLSRADIHEIQDYWPSGILSENRVRIAIFDHAPEEGPAAYTAEVAKQWGWGAPDDNHVLLCYFARERTPEVQLSDMFPKYGFTQADADTLLREQVQPLLAQGKVVDALRVAHRKLYWKALGADATQRGSTTDKLMARLFGASTFFFVLFLLFALCVAIPSILYGLYISWTLFQRGAGKFG